MTGIEIIAAERKRQIESLNWTADHDDVTNRMGELSMAAGAYANVASAIARGADAEEFSADMMLSEGDWPWDEDSWKPSNDVIRNLAKAGALIAAEIDRLQRKSP